LHPYYEITLRGTPELAAACRKFLDARGDDSNGWALAWRMNLWARLGDGDRAHKLFKLLLRPAGGGSGSLPNLLGSCPPFQIEANFGGCAGVAECLLQSHEGRADFSPPESEVRKTDAPCEIELLPALPSAWPDGSVKGLKARGGFIVDINWQAGRVTTATIRSTQGGEARVRIGERLVPINLKPGESRILTNG
jgi:alpha-L-fucosidase 2